MDNKKVSIIIPAYNAADYLAEAIDSALAQTYENTEIIVVNDGSPDHGATKRIAESYGDKIRYFEKTNGGCASALNYGIKQMTGFWFSWLSHDDLYLPEKLSKLVSLTDQYGVDPERTVLGCNDLIMGPSNTASANIFNNSKGVKEPVQAFGETLTKKVFNGCGLLIPKTILDESGEFRTDYRHLLDLEYWIRIAANGFAYCFTDEPLVISRVHDQQITIKARDSLFREEDRLIEEYITVTSQKDDKGFLKELCLYAAKRQHFALQKKISRILKQQGELDLNTRMRISFRTIEGSLKKLVRNRYMNYLRKK